MANTFNTMLLVTRKYLLVLTLRQMDEVICVISVHQKIIRPKMLFSFLTIFVKLRCRIYLNFTFPSNYVTFPRFDFAHIHHSNNFKIVN